MEVIARDVLQDVRGAGVDRHVVADAIAERFRSLAIDEDRLEFVPGGQGSLDDQVTLGDEPAGHLAAGLFALLAQRVVSQALEHDDPWVLVVGDLESRHSAPRVTICPSNDVAYWLG